MPIATHIESQALEILTRFHRCGSNVRSASPRLSDFLELLGFARREIPSFLPALRYLLRSQALAIVPANGAHILAPVQRREEQIYWELLSSAGSVAGLEVVLDALGQMHLRLEMAEPDLVNPELVAQIQLLIRTALAIIQRAQ